MRALNDTATIFPVTFGQSKNYSITINDQGSFNPFLHNNGVIGSAPNQPYLELLGDDFPPNDDSRFELEEFSLPSDLLYLEDQFELVMGPLETNMGLVITRKIHIDPADDVVRVLEIVHNPTPSQITVSLRITSPTFGALLVDESGDGVLSGFDRFFASFDASAGGVGVLVDGDGADRVDVLDDNIDETEFEWRDVTVAPDGTAVYAHFVFLQAENDAGQMRTKLEGLVAAPPWGGLTEDEAAAIRNFAATAPANVVGTLGAATPGTLSVSNQRTGESRTAPVGGDGSFAVVLDAALGDQIRIVHDSGDEITVTVQGG